jgi:hypothetical protein
MGRRDVEVTNVAVHWPSRRVAAGLALVLAGASIAFSDPAALAADPPATAPPATAYVFDAPSDGGDQAPLIYGGSATTNPGWIVAIFRDGFYLCTGILIDPQVVLTAAHCVESQGEYRLIFGSTYLYGSPIERIGTTFVVHPGWQGTLGDTDLAVIGFDDPVTTLPMATLNATPGWPELQQPVTAAGWGMWAADSGPSSSLQVAGFVTTSGMDGSVDPDYCELDPAGATPGGVFCFGGPVDASACPGDSGGPVAGWATPETTSGPIVVYGLVSYGPSTCGISPLDGKAQSVGAHALWIETMVDLITDPPPPMEDDSTGLVNPDTGEWFLLNRKGIALTSFFYGNPGDYPFMGDWDGDGVETPGLYRRSDGYVYLRNSNTQGIADIRFFFGNPGDVPVAGDFDGDGFDTVSIYRPSNQTFYIINKLGSNDGGLGAAEASYVFGNPGDQPFVGDFDGDGVETAGLHRASTGLVYFRNSHSQGNADEQFVFGDPGDRLIAGDWTGDAVSTPGLFRPSDTTVYLRYTNTQGIADDQFVPVPTDPSWIPIAGHTGL